MGSAVKTMRSIVTIHAVIEFSKLHGIGNDFVFIDLVGKEDSSDRPALARLLCDRHKGVGADGLIIVERAERAPFRMTMFNPDGSNGGMCGNGVRCAARLLFDHGHIGLEPFNLEVEERIVNVEPIRPDWINVDMGTALLTRGEIGMLGDPAEQFVDAELTGTTYRATAVSMGNPHVVIFVDDLESVDVHKLGPALEHHPLFPFRTNAHFVQRLSETRLRMKIWERGAGATLACGSGACAVGVAGYLTGRTGRQVTIELPGGELEIEYREDGRVLMTGPAEHVFDGNYAARANALR